ncbi:MAG: hypothetical protein ACE5DX_04580 [Candidatus Dojkabacteria bacterium]
MQPGIAETEYLGDPIQGDLVRDQSQEFDLPFQLDDLPRPSAHEIDKGGLPQGKKLGTRSTVEGRSYSYLPVYILRRHQVKLHPRTTIYSDIQIKGGGGRVKEGTLVERTTDADGNLVFDSGKAIPEVVKSGGKRWITRFSEKDIWSLRSRLGVVSVESGLRDFYTNDYLESNFGLRTRALVAIWEWPDDASISTDEGVITLADFKEDVEGTPGYEAWALRCKYRIQDYTRFTAELLADDNRRLPFAGGDTTIQRKKKGKYDRYLSHDPENRPLTKAEQTQAREQSLFLAQQIILRARNDEDPRFQELAATFTDLLAVDQIDKDDNWLVELEKFYLNYLPIFSEVLGEQFGILEEAGAISGAFNSQNITLLAEVVDHDVTIIDGKQFNEAGELKPLSQSKRQLYKENFDPEDSDKNSITQLMRGWIAVSQLMRDLSRTGIIQITEESTSQIRETFLSGYVQQLEKSLNEAELSERKSNFSNFLDKNRDNELFLTLHNVHRPPVEEDYLGDGIIIRFVEQASRLFSETADTRVAA